MNRSVLVSIALLSALSLGGCAFVPPVVTVSAGTASPSPKKTVGGGVIVDVETGESKEIPVRVLEDPSPEIVAAAERHVGAFLAAYSQAMGAGSYATADFEPYTAGKLLDRMNPDTNRLLPDGYHTTGTVLVDGLDPELWDPETGTLRGFACEDRSGIRMFDASGADMTEQYVGWRLEADVTITGLPDSPRLVSYTPYPSLDAC